MHFLSNDYVPSNVTIPAIHTIKFFNTPFILVKHVFDIQLLFQLLFTYLKFDDFFSQTQRWFSFSIFLNISSQCHCQIQDVLDILYKVLTWNTTNNVLLLNHIILHLEKLPVEWVVFSNWNFKVCVSQNYQ
jgi:hypothetical protein